MGEEIGGRGLAGKILSAGKRLNECAHIGDESGVLVVEQRLNIGQVGIESELGRGCEREQRVLRQRKVAAQRRVIPVARRIKGNERIVGIVAAKEKDTHQRLVAWASFARAH